MWKHQHFKTEPIINSNRVGHKSKHDPIQTNLYERTLSRCCETCSLTPSKSDPSELSLSSPILKTDGSLRYRRPCRSAPLTWLKLSKILIVKMFSVAYYMIIAIKFSDKGSKCDTITAKSIAKYGRDWFYKTVVMKAIISVSWNKLHSTANALPPPVTIHRLRRFLRSRTGDVLEDATFHERWFVFDSRLHSIHHRLKWNC